MNKHAINSNAEKSKGETRNEETKKKRNGEKEEKSIGENEKKGEKRSLS